MPEKCESREIPLFSILAWSGAYMVFGRKEEEVRHEHGSTVVNNSHRLSLFLPRLSRIP